MTDGNDGANGNEDLKAKMREALERKQSGASGVKKTTHDKGHAEEHGAVGGKRLHRRKSG